MEPGFVAGSGASDQPDALSFRLDLDGSARDDPNPRATALAFLTAMLLANAERCAADGYPSKFTLGETASDGDVAKIAIAIPADGAGLPVGQGDYEAGKQLYANTCAACHGDKLQG